MTRPVAGEADPAQGEVPVRPAAGVTLVRDGPDGPEVFLGERTSRTRFMGGAWVFPGGRVDPEDAVQDDDDGMRAAAVRELREEAAVVADPATLVPFARWITPEGLNRRYDTVFFLAALPANAEPAVDGTELVRGRWLTPRAAVAEAYAETMMIAFPTVHQLRSLEGFDDAAALLRHYAGRGAPEPVLPRVVQGPDGPGVRLPGEPD